MRYNKKQEEALKKRDKKKQIFRLRGMKDIVFNERKYWDIVVNKATELSKIYGFKMIKTPVLEKSDLYKKSTGIDTDIVGKEMYEFVDKNGEKIALRPEATPSLVRAYIEHGMFTKSQPVKLSWIGSIFRHEKPQAGRYRQAHQFDLEIFGEDSPMADFLIILIAYNFFSELQIETQIQINSIGCSNCRPDYIDSLKKYYKKHKADLCNDCKKRLVKNPLRILDCKEEKCIEINNDAPPIIDHLCESCQESLTTVLEYMDEMNIPYDLNNRLVRGLDYYNGIVFEIVALNDNDSFSLGGGGRYDRLVESMGGVPTCACGFGIGIERTMLKLKQCNIPINNKDNDLVFLAQLGDQAKRKSFLLFEKLRKAGLNVRQSFTKNSLKKQLEDANRMKANICLILGQKEVNDNVILVRDMESGNQESIEFDNVQEEIEKRLKKNKRY